MRQLGHCARVGAHPDGTTFGVPTRQESIECSRARNGHSRAHVNRTREITRRDQIPIGGDRNSRYGLRLRVSEALRQRVHTRRVEQRNEGIVDVGIDDTSAAQIEGTAEIPADEDFSCGADGDCRGRCSIRAHSHAQLGPRRIAERIEFRCKRDFGCRRRHHAAAEIDRTSNVACEIHISHRIEGHGAAILIACRITESTAPLVHPVRREFRQKNVVKPGARQRRAPKVDVVLEKPGDDDVSGRIDGHTAGILHVRIAEALAPNVTSVRTEFGKKYIDEECSRRVQVAAAEIDRSFEAAGHVHVATRVDTDARRVLHVAITEFLGP